MEIAWECQSERANYLLSNARWWGKRVTDTASPCRAARVVREETESEEEEGHLPKGASAWNNCSAVVPSDGTACWDALRAVRGVGWRHAGAWDPFWRGEWERRQKEDCVVFSSPFIRKTYQAWSWQPWLNISRQALKITACWASAAARVFLANRHGALKELWSYNQKHRHSLATALGKTREAGFYLWVVPTLKLMLLLSFSLTNFHHYNPNLSNSHTHLKTCSAEGVGQG